MNGGDGGFGNGPGGEEGATSSPVRIDGGSCFEGVSELLSSWRNLKIKDEEKKKKKKADLEGDLPQLDWISELVQ